MIFSTKYCLICKSELKMRAVELLNQNIAFEYYCLNTITIKHNNSLSVKYDHFINTINGQDEQSRFIIDMFQIENFKNSNKTYVYKMDPPKRRLIFESGLLDFDYSDPYTLNRLKKLFIFS